MSKRGALALVLAVALGCSWLGADQPPEKPRWSYVADDAQALGLRVFQSVPLSLEKPEGIKEHVSYRGSRRLYGQLRYGTEDSTRVFVVLDEVSRNDFDLYVDRDRSRSIRANEKVEGKGRLRTASLDAEIRNGDSATHLRRTVLLRRGATGQSLGIATAGYVEGRISVAGNALATRRVDGDANGLFADAADRVWIDLNDDGQWDALSEQFPFTPVLHLATRRYAVRGDGLGQSFALEEMTGEGRIRLHLPALVKGANVTRIEVSLTDGSGAAYSVQGLEKATTMPIGKFAIYAVVLHVQDDRRPEPWCWSFVYAGTPRKWHEVRKDEELLLDPLGKLRFELETSDECQAGQDLGVRPRLYTQDGLLISSCSFGQSDPSKDEKHNCATVKLQAGGQVVSTAQSGFA